MMTYGDDVSDINIEELVEFCKSHGKLLIFTAASLQQRIGVLDIADDNTISSFR